MDRPESAWERYWFAPRSLVRLAALRVLLSGLAIANVLGYASTVLADADAVGAGTISKAWRPIYLFEVLGVEPLGPAAARALLALCLAALVCALIGLVTRPACLLAAALHVAWVGLAYSFAKVHHDSVALAFALLALALGPSGARLSVDAQIARLRRVRAGLDPTRVPRRSRRARLPIALIQLTVALGYCASGVSKLALAGPAWANGYTLMAILARYDNAWSAAFVGHPELCRVLSVATLVVQGTFPLVLVFPRTRWFYLPAAVLFHLSTWRTMDTGPYVSLWFTLVAFLPLERVPRWVARAVTDGALPARVARGAVALVPVALVLWLFGLYFPAWAWLLLVPPLWAFALLLSPMERLELRFDPADRRAARAAAWARAASWSGLLAFRAASGGGVRVLDRRGTALAPGAAAWAVAHRLVPPLCWLWPAGHPLAAARRRFP